MRGAGVVLTQWVRHEDYFVGNTTRWYGMANAIKALAPSKPREWTLKSIGKVINLQSRATNVVLLSCIDLRISVHGLLLKF